MKYIDCVRTDLNYELFDDKVYLFRCNGKIVNVFDLKDQIFLENAYSVNENVLIIWRTDKNYRLCEYGSIVDLKNKKYIKDVFTLYWYYKQVVDRYSDYESGQGPDTTRITHDEKVRRGDYVIDNNIIKYTITINGEEKTIIYDANTGKLIGEENITVYDPKEGHLVYRNKSGKESKQGKKRIHKK